MSDIEERDCAGLVLSIDRTLCVGFGDCVEVAPDAFELDDEDIATFRADPDGVDRDRLIDACRACPVDAISAFDEDGHQLAP